MSLFLTLLFNSAKQTLISTDWKPKASDDDVELLLDPGSASQPSTGLSELEEMLDRDVNDYDVSPRSLPDPKKQKLNDDQDMRTMLQEGHSSQYDLKWVGELHQPDDGLLDFYNLVVDNDLDCLSMELDLGFMSNRKYKNFLRIPTAYLVKKMRDSEVVLSKLSPQHQQLFARAKGKEIDSFLKNEAVKACHRNDEVRGATGSGRIVRARWVLTWKLVPPEDQAEAQQDAAINPSSTHTADGLKKAKARIVLLGFGNLRLAMWSTKRPHLCNQCWRATCSTRPLVNTHGNLKAWTWQLPSSRLLLRLLMPTCGLIVLLNILRMCFWDSIRVLALLGCCWQH